MMENNFLQGIKVAVVAFFAGFTAWLGALAVPVYTLLSTNVIDYLTGLWAAPYRGEKRNSDKGLRGILKKGCMWLMVIVAGLMDWLITSAADGMGIVIPFSFPLAAAVCIWLLCNEVISILENISDIGVDHPAFLNKMIAWLKKTVEEKVEVKNKEGKGDGQNMD